jgi:concanavalin A-like lectin/glucanase superfamily protein
VGRLRRVAPFLAVVFIAFAPSSAGAASLAASWPMNEFGGTTMFDSSGNGNNGTLMGGVTPTGATYAFDGTGWVSVPNSSSLIPGSANIDITLQIATTSMPGTGDFDFDLLRKGNNAQYRVELYPKNGRAVGLCRFKGDLAGVTVKGGPSLNDGNWHTIECIKTAKSVQLKVDGATVKTVNTAVGTISSTKNLAVGSKYGSADWYMGQMRNVTISFG